MASVLIEKTLQFSGIWKPSPRASQDALLRQIGTQFLAKKSLSATYQLCTDGLRLIVVRDNGRQRPKSEKIPITSIQDICANRYNGTCLMTIYIDSDKRVNYLVCRCDSETDASHIVLRFSDYKKSLSGEGYRIPIAKPQGTNWTLMPKENGMNGHSEMSSDSSDYRDGVVRAEVANNRVQSTGTSTQHHVKIETDTETFEREACEIEGKPGFSVAVQTNFEETDSDRDSMMSTTSYRSLKEELLSLSQEIRDIKFLLEKTTGISAEEYYKRDENDNNIRHRTQVHIPEDGQDLPSPTESNHSADKHVNFAERSDMPDYDIRQVGVQTERGRKGYYVKRQGRSEVRTMYTTKGSARQRSSSSNSAPRSPASIGRAGGNEVFELPPPSGRTLVRGTELQGRAGYSSTIERPIEQVYTVYSRNFRNPRSKILVMPSGGGTMPAMRRPKSSSRSSVNDVENGH